MLGRILLGLLALVLLVLGGLVAWLYTPDRSRGAAEARFSRGPQDFVTVGDMRFHVRQEGPAGAPVLVMIHGNASQLQSWDGWAADLSRDYRVIRYDLAGHGLTGPDPAGSYGPERDAAQLLALLDALGVQRASLIGNSLGGQIAWTFAAAHPDRVEKLVLVAPGGYPLPGIGFGQTVEPPAAAKLRPYILNKQTVRLTLSPLYGDPSRFGPEAVDRYYESWRSPGVRQAGLDRVRAYRIEDPTDRLRSIQAPTLLVWGEKDWLVAFATTPAKFQAALPNSRLVSFPGLGHMPQEEDPATTVHAVRAFLAE
ncbi:alpha/beta hydrolase [Niveispirillum sp. BGYR6]|uniref:alpha/beta fold hydrolase n=1 Tax=Niveispirillum sp. BGYR6 TaxID=2971249 RepID=UPI0022B95A7C|nr:alpha/beta hydrolase [Niveispirillum sp. BGYR6]MDG5495779.1 alpha/beta hydrolase [Niveispirillum sp. BGYR6]